MRILETAYNLSIKLFPGSDQKYNHFAFMFERNKLISIGQNNMKETSAKALYFGNLFNVKSFQEFSYIHAEIDCISKLWGKRYLSGREKIVVVRLNKHGELLNSKPCSSCSSVLSSIGMNKVWFSTPEGFKSIID